MTTPTPDRARGKRADELRRRRKALGLTQAQLATAMGLHPNSIAVKECSRRPVTDRDLAMLAMLEQQAAQAAERSE